MAQNPSDLLKELKRLSDDGRLPPVHLWNPPLCDNIRMRIDRQGRWYYMDSPIGRESMVRLFSTVLRRDEDGYYLVTPVEKIRVDVEDCPFIITGWDSAGEGVERVVSFQTNVQERFALDREHPLEICERDAPRVMVRSGLRALLSRPVFYQLAALALEEFENSPDISQPGIYSCGEFFALVAEPD